MLIRQFSMSNVQIALLLIYGAFIFHVIKNRYCRGLNKIPGPILASLSNLWRLFDVWGRRPDRTHLKLHERYGDVVRIGPNVVSVGDPKAVQVVYRLNAGLTKSDF